MKRAMKAKPKIPRAASNVRFKKAGNARPQVLLVQRPPAATTSSKVPKPAKATMNAASIAKSRLHATATRMGKTALKVNAETASSTKASRATTAI